MGVSYGCVGKAKSLDCTGKFTNNTNDKILQYYSVSENNEHIRTKKDEEKEEIPLLIVNNDIGKQSPKRTLFAWMRLGHSGVDLSGTDGQLLDVTTAQLAKHNSRTDAWIAIKGCVYNVTAYLDYHPGGTEELMKGVGTDATQLFNQVHKWVSYENILKKCLVGKLLEPQEDPKIVDTYDNNNVQEDKSQDCMLETANILLNWTQNVEDVTVTLTTGWPHITRDRVVVLKKNEVLKILYYLENSVYIFHQELPELIKEHIEVEIEENSKVNIILKKVEVGTFWSIFGTPLEGHNTVFNVTKLESEYISCVLENRRQLTHDTWLVVLALPASSYMPVPLGYHVYLRLPGTDHVRPYTPVTSKLDPTALQEDQGKKLHFLIKVYSSGQVTSSLAQLTVGDTLEVSIPDGQFQHHRVVTVTSQPNCILVCLAAGTGITPMVNLMLHQLSINRKVVLLWFNKTEKDIAWKEELYRLQRSHKNLFKVVYVVSAASIFWEGYCGRITTNILRKELPPPGNPFTQDSPSFVCICGPSGFNHLAKRLVTELEYREDHVHIFQG